MANITPKRQGEMLRGLFKILSKFPEGLKAKEALAKLEIELPPTPYEAGNYEKTGIKRFEKIARFATISTVKAAWLNKTKGVWSLTDEGLAALAKFTDPESFYKEASKLYKAWKEQQPEETESIPEEGDQAAITIEQAEEQAWNEIEEHLKTINPYDFQDLAATLLKAMGYFVTWVAPPGKDGGVDIIANSDPLGTKAPRIKVQVKRLSNTVAVDGLRAFLALLGNDDVGIFINTGGFTREAEDLARSQETRKITLINLDKFFDLWIMHYGKIEEKGKRLFPLQPVYFLSPLA